MEEERIVAYVFYLLALVALVTRSSHISTQCPDKLFTCPCPGGLSKHVKTKVAQCQVGAAGCQPCERKSVCLTKEVLSLCTQDRRRRNIRGKEVVNSTLSPTTFRVQQKQDVKYICEKDGFIRTPSEQPGAPLVKLVSGSVRVVLMDERVILRCVVRSQSTAIITWSIQTASQKRTLVPKDGLGSWRYHIRDCGQELHILYANTSDSGSYICMVKNEHGTVKRLSNLKVRPRQEIGETLVISNVQLEDGSPHAIVGSDIVLTCELYGVGDVRKIWKKDGKRISDDGKRIVWDYSESSSKKLHKKFKLLIYNVSVDDGGTYTCLARSTKFSTRVSKEFSLEIETVSEETSQTSENVSNVTKKQDSYVCQESGVIRTPLTRPGLPRVKLQSGSHTDATEGETVVLRCVVRSQTPATISWSFQTEIHNRKLVPGDISDRYRTHDCGQELHIQYAETSDSGNYICTVKNEYGYAEQIVNLEVKGDCKVSRSRSRVAVRNDDDISPIVILLSSAVGLLSVLLFVTILVWFKSRRQLKFRPCTVLKLQEAGNSGPVDVLCKK